MNKIIKKNKECRICFSRNLKKVLSSAVQEIPESSISGTEAKRLYKNIINETAR